jgi:signal peptidase I
MSLFLSGLALTAAGQAMVAYGRRRGETDEVNSRLLSLGYSCAIFGPFLLLVYVATLPSALLVAAAVSGLLWGADWLAKRTHGRRWTSGVARYGSDAFLMVLGVCLVRFFVVEPFVVPSSSMRPTLSVGDVIIVDKFSYGIRLPVLNLPLIPIGQPARGQMIVFEYPPDRSRAFVKRVIGIPGDTVRVDDAGIEINGERLLQTPAGSYTYTSDAGHPVAADQFVERLESTRYQSLHRPGTPWADLAAVVALHPKDGCAFGRAGMQCIVPPGHYFVLGDNRSDSLDGRYWGFVPDSHLLGRVDAVLGNTSGPRYTGVWLR